jgi:hypothetical protein
MSFKIVDSVNPQGKYSSIHLIFITHDHIKKKKALPAGGFFSNLSKSFGYQWPCVSLAFAKRRGDKALHVITCHK